MVTMKDYETTKFELIQLQAILNSVTNIHSCLMPYIWILRAQSTGKILASYVVNGRIPLEARLTGDLYFMRDTAVPTYAKSRIVNSGHVEVYIDVVRLCDAGASL